MDDARFDRLARLLGGAGTRRGALAGLLGGLFGGAGFGSTAGAGAARDRHGDAEAAGRRRRRRKCDPACGANFECLNGRCHCPTVGCGAVCCPAGQVCQNGACAEVVACHAYGATCGDSVPCCDGLECGSGYGGAPVGCWRVAGSTCAANEECGYGRRCRKGVCIVDPPPCNGGCPAPLTCRYDACVYVTPSQVAAFGTFGDSSTATLGATDGYLSNPTMVALDATGSTAWIADRSNNRVVVWVRSGGGWSHVASLGNGGSGVPGSGTGELYNAYGVAVNPQGTTAWIADSGDNSPSGQSTYPNNRVTIWTRSGGAWSQTDQFGEYGIATGASQTDGLLGEPYGIWVDAAGRTAFIADKDNNRIVIWKDLAGTWTHTASFGTQGSTGLSQTDGLLNKPRSVAVDATGQTAWVADSNNQRVTVWSRTAGTWRQVASLGTPGPATGPTDGMMGGPYGVAVDPSGSLLWVAQNDQNRVTVWANPGGAWSQITSFGSPGSQVGPRKGPRGVAYLPGGTVLWVADSENNRITVWE